MRWVLELLSDVSHCWYFSVPGRVSVSFSRCCFTTSVNIKRLSRATKRCLSQFVKANNCECGPLSLSLFIEGMLRLMIWISSKCNKCLNCQKSKNSFRLYSYCVCVCHCLFVSSSLLFTQSWRSSKPLYYWSLHGKFLQVGSIGSRLGLCAVHCRLVDGQCTYLYYNAIFKTRWVQCSAVSHCQCGSRPSSFAAEAAVGRFGSWALLGPTWVLLGLAGSLAGPCWALLGLLLGLVAAAVGLQARIQASILKCWSHHQPLWIC